MSQILQILTAGEQRVFSPTATVTVGRDPGSDIVVSNPRASGRHGILRNDGNCWVYSDQGSTNGTWIGGRRLSGPERITTPVTLRLGTIDSYDEIVLSVAAEEVKREPQRTLSMSASDGGSPRSIGARRDDLVIDFAGTTQRFSTGTIITLGRDEYSTIVLPSRTSSGRHAEIRHENGVWVFSDAGSTNGSWSGDSRVDKQVIRGRVQLRLGKPDEGSDIVLSTDARAASNETVVVPGGGGGSVTADPAHSLLVIVAGNTAVLAADTSRVYRVGRDPSVDVTVRSERASRSHLRLEWTGSGWLAKDTSSGGTFRPGGARLQLGVGIPITEETKLLLGDPVAGELLTLEPADSQATPGPWWKKPWAWAAAAAFLVVALIGATLVVNSGASTAGPTFDLDAVKKSVVRLRMHDTQGKSMGTGSGTIISPNGLILTNAHVAAPTSPGQAAQYGFGKGDPPAVGHLIVGMSLDPAQPASDTYRAELLVADGYVDLAVVKITAKADGSPLDGEVNLPALPLAPDGEIATGDPLTVLGFPGAAQSEYITVTRGNMSAFVADPHMNSDRAFFESSADIRSGNSGGTAVDGKGRLVGVPTQQSSLGRDSSDRARPVEFARPLIQIAENGGDPNYFSPYLVPVDPAAKVLEWGVSTNEVDSCSDILSTRQAIARAPLIVAFHMSAKKGVDQYATIWTVENEKRGRIIAHGLPTQHVAGACAVVAYPDGLPAGTYAAALFIGPNNEKLVDNFTFSVGTSGESQGNQGQDGTSNESAACRAGNPISSWPFQQSVQLAAVSQASDGKQVFAGGKILVVRIIGEQGGYATADEANKAAAGAVNRELATAGPYPGVRFQRWMVVAWNGRYYAVLGQHRPLTILDENKRPIPNPANNDWCYTPDEEYKIQQWHGLDYVTGTGWIYYDSAKNEFSVLR